MNEQVSDRVIEKRLRNRVIDAVEILALGNEGLVKLNYNVSFERFTTAGMLGDRSGGK